MGCTTQSREIEGINGIIIINNQSKYIDLFNWINKNIAFIHPLGSWDE